MLNFLHSVFPKNELVSSKLLNETTFYQFFLKDLQECQKEVIIESPFVTSSRAQFLRPIFQSLLYRKIAVYLITRDPEEHEETLAVQAEGELAELMLIGVRVILCRGNHHRKTAIIDRKIVYEGSLNILSQRYSKEVMRRIESKNIALEMFDFLQINRLLSKNNVLGYNNRYEYNEIYRG